MNSPRVPPTLAFAVLLGLGGPPAPLSAQYDEVAIPDEVGQLEFLLGTWTVTGAFRTPDVIDEGRRLWYRTDKGVARFDGEAWASWEPGADAEADRILARIDRDGAGAPFTYSFTRIARPVQDGFGLIVDDGRTGGTLLFYFDAARGLWGQRAFHAASGTFDFRESTGTVEAGILHLTGSGRDRRGERLIRTRFEPKTRERYEVHTDVSFDGGRHWILDQTTQQAARR